MPTRRCDLLLASWVLSRTPYEVHGCLFEEWVGCEMPNNAFIKSESNKEKQRSLLSLRHPLSPSPSLRDLPKLLKSLGAPILPMNPTVWVRTAYLGIQKKIENERFKDSRKLFDLRMRRRGGRLWRNGFKR
jgi:hypothetical protein